MAITNHVNFSGLSPFTGPVFTDIWKLWDPDLTALIRPYCKQHGVYGFLRGPEFQTEAESTLMAAGGVDMVGMSTVMEAIALHAMGVKVAGISVTSDLSFSPTPTTHEQVLAAAKGAWGPVRQAVEVLRTSIFA